MDDQRAYWESRILAWEERTYSPGDSSSGSFLDMAAAPFGKILRRRMDVGIQLVKDHVKDKVVVDCGCGTGSFLIRLLPYAPRTLIGVDIAQPAIDGAKRATHAIGMQERVHFECKDIRQDFSSLDPADVITGIGFIDYLAPAELRKFVRTIGTRMFLLSFPEKTALPRELLHRAYVKLTGCPGSYHYSRVEMDHVLEEAGAKGWWYYGDAEKIRFVTNLPGIQSSRE